MKKVRIAIRPLPTPECVASLAPAIAALKKKHNGCSVGLLAEENLREASLLLPALDFFVSSTSGHEDGHCDFTIDLRGTESFEDSAENPEWKTYLLGAPEILSSNPYHLVDLLKKAAQVDNVDINFELSLPETSGTLPQALSQPGGLRVGVCTSSLSQTQLEATLEGISQLVNQPTEVFLLGTVKDKKLSSQVTARWDGKLNVTDLCGHQGLVENAAVLRACDINITGPGLNAILSSGFGTFTICIDETPERGPFLYPYGHGHLVVQKSGAVPLAGSQAAFLKEIIHYAITANSGSVPSLEQWQEFSDSMIFGYLGKIRLFATQRIEIVFKDAGSFTELYLRPMLFTGAEVHDVLLTFYRLLWEHSLHQRTITTYDLQILHQDTMPILCDLLKPLEQLYELGNFGRTYSGYVRESLAKGDVAKARHESERLQEVEELIHSLVSAQPHLSPLFVYHRQAQRLMAGDTPLALADEMASLFSGLQERVLVLLDLAKSLFHTVFENESALAMNGAVEKADSNG
ncbi:MAG: glycosyltransferase family 9 protein [Bdellovibrionota bacterium]